MKCARLHLHARSKPRGSPVRAAPAPDRPRRYCQKRMVNPAHEEDPRWTGLFDRFYCNQSADTARSTVDNGQVQPTEDIFLSVQNINFDGDVTERKRTKTCFKYKAISDGKKHRMFVKQVVEAEENSEECSSQLTCYYFNDYVKNILNSEQIAPSSDKASIVHCAQSNKIRQNKSVQVEAGLQEYDVKKCHPVENIPKDKRSVKQIEETVKDEPPDLGSEDTKIAYHKSGKRKCLTISRVPSPETVQVIRVDVVCAARTPDYDDKQSDLDQHSLISSKIINNINLKTAHFSNKYLLTNTTKALDENVSGGAKVTLVCKTFRLSRRNKPNEKKAYKIKKESQN